MTIAGKWTGIDNDGDRWGLELIEGEGGAISGTYTLQIVGSLTFHDSVTGSYDYPAVSWDLASSFPGILTSVATSEEPWLSPAKDSPER